MTQVAFGCHQCTHHSPSHTGQGPSRLLRKKTADFDVCLKVVIIKHFKFFWGRTSCTASTCLPLTVGMEKSWYECCSNITKFWITECSISYCVILCIETSLSKNLRRQKNQKQINSKVMVWALNTVFPVLTRCSFLAASHIFDIITTAITQRQQQS